MTRRNSARINKMHRIKSILILLFTLTVLSCDSQKIAFEGNETGFESFIESYNAFIEKWLLEEEERLSDLLKKAEKSEVKQLKRELKKTQFRISLGDFLERKTEGDLPSKLKWKDGAKEKEFGDPAALKGGVLRSYLAFFPNTLRPVGPNANHPYRDTLYSNVQIGLVGIHPVTKNYIPGEAKRWAISKDKRTVYYHLDPEAKFTNGEDLSSENYLYWFYVRLSDNVSNPFAKRGVKESIAKVTTYGSEYISVTLPEQQPRMVSSAAVASTPIEFFKEYGADYEERYQWRYEPHTGPYYLDEKDLVKGQSIALTRDKDWWGKDRKFYKHMYNVDKFSYRLIRDENKAYELFKIGQIDFFNMNRSPAYWYEKSEAEPFFKGYIEKAQFFTEYPRIPWGVHLNLAIPKLQDKNFRIALQHSMNWDRVINSLYRGDYNRLNQFCEGYGKFTNSKITAREYSLTKARAYFAKAGYDTLKEGYLTNKNGEVASIILSNRNTPAIYQKMMKILIEDAKKIGLKVINDSTEITVYFRKLSGKRFEAGYSGWGARPPYPGLHQFLHSSFALDSEGNPKPNTNNVFTYANPKMDKLLEGAKFARTEEEVLQNTLKAQQLLHDEAIFIPAFKKTFERIAYWRWLKWPDTEQIQFNARRIEQPLTEPLGLHLFWIDPELKKETLDAKRNGTTFPERVRSI